MAITDRPAVLGNQTDEDSALTGKVSFIGQVPVRVRGVVNLGDWIVPSGEDDGICMAIPSNELRLDHHVVGRAWESSNDPGIKRVNTAVGLDQSEILKHIIESQQSQIDEFRAILLKMKVSLIELNGGGVNH